MKNIWQHVVNETTMTFTNHNTRVHKNEIYEGGIGSQRRQNHLLILWDEKKPHTHSYVGILNYVSLFQFVDNV